MGYNIEITNSRTGQRELFVPLDPDQIRMYVCGPTVYDRAHIGNARSAVVFDVVFRLLRDRYGADQVRYARNFTDIDDKIIQRAAETGTDIRSLTDQTIGWYRSDMAELGVLQPTYEPRATDHIPDMIDIIQRLLANGHAYITPAGVLFSSESRPKYGEFSGRRMDQNRDHPEYLQHKRHPADWVLWKPWITQSLRHH